jgi:ribonuclease D
MAGFAVRGYARLSAIALDTEFVRTRTYYPQLGLLQMFDGKQVSLIDPLGITDWAPMRELLLNTVPNTCTPAVKIWKSFSTPLA